MIAREIAGLFAEVSDALPRGLGPFEGLWSKDGGDGPDDDLLDPAAIPPLDGSCVVGVIDHAVPFAHRQLTLPGGVSRVASIWLQDGLPSPHAVAGAGLPFGTELRGPTITRLIARHRRAGHSDEEAIYRDAGAISFAPPRRTALARTRSHGAAVAMLAAGRAPGEPAARRRPVIAVGLPDEVVRDASGTLAPYYILMGTLHVLHRARLLGQARGAPLPVSIVLSMGVTAGAKDGTGLVDRFQDAVVRAGPGLGLGPVRFVVPMGNHRQARAAALLNGDDTIGWRTLPDDRTPSYLQIRLAPGAASHLSLAPPGGEPIETALPPSGSARDLMFGGRHAARLYAAEETGAHGPRTVLTLALPPTDGSAGANVVARPGQWMLRLPGLEGDAEIYVQRDERIAALRSGGRQSHLVHPAYRGRDDLGRAIMEDDASAGPIRRGMSVSAYACGRNQMRVGSRRPNEPDRAAPFSGRHDRGADGPAPDGDMLVDSDRGPSRPGILVRGTRGGARSLMRGTSVSAAIHAAAVADELAAQDRTTSR